MEMSFRKFTKTISNGQIHPDVFFQFDSNQENKKTKQEQEEAAILAHANVLSYVSPVFMKDLAENTNNRNEHHQIILLLKDVDPVTFKDFLRWIYEGYTKETFSPEMTSNLLRLAQRYHVKAEIVEEIFCMENILQCLEVALEDPDKDSNLTKKCTAQVRSNKAVYTDLIYEDMKASTLVFILQQNQLPLDMNEVKQMCERWQRNHTNDPNFATEFMNIHTELVNYFSRNFPERQKPTPILNVSCIGLKPFTVPFDAGLPLLVVLQDINNYTQIELQRISLKNSRKLLEESQRTLQTYGLKEGATLNMEIKQKILLREFTGKIHELYIRGSESVENLRKMVIEKLATSEKKLKPDQVKLIYNRVELVCLIKPKLLSECDIHEGAEISLIVLEEAQPQTEATTLHIQYSEENFALAAEIYVMSCAEEGGIVSSTEKGARPQYRLQGGLQYPQGWDAQHDLIRPKADTLKAESSCLPAYWVCQLRESKILGRLKFTWTNNSPSTFLLEASNDHNIWKNLLLKTDETGTNGEVKIYEIENHTAYLCYRILVIKSVGHIQDVQTMNGPRPPQHFVSGFQFSSSHQPSASRRHPQSHQPPIFILHSVELNEPHTDNLASAIPYQFQFQNQSQNQFLYALNLNL